MPLTHNGPDLDTPARAMRPVRPDAPPPSERGDDIERDLPSQIPSMLRPAQAAVKAPEAILPPTNRVAKRATECYLLLEQLIETRASGAASVTDRQVRDAQARLQVAEDNVAKETRRFVRERAMVAKAEAKVAEKRAAALRARVRDAELLARQNGPVVTVLYRGVRVTAYPERALDQTSRLFCLNGFADALQVTRNDFERALAVAITDAKSMKPLLAPMDQNRLIDEIKDVARRAIARNLITVRKVKRA